MYNIANYTYKVVFIYIKNKVGCDCHNSGKNLYKGRY